VTVRKQDTGAGCVALMIGSLLLSASAFCLVFATEVGPRWLTILSSATAGFLLPFGALVLLVAWTTHREERKERWSDRMRPK
jgi:hypothetical protein